MGYKKTIIFLMFTIFIFSITVVSASDMNDTAINSDDTSQMELTASNEMDVDNLQLSEENTTLVYANNVESEGEEINSAVVRADTGTYSGLAEEISHGRNIELQHTYYTYDIGNTIEITVDNSVIDGKGAIIDMAGSNTRAFHVTAYDVTIKNLTIKNANHNSNGGAIYFSSSGTVTDCNFINNTASTLGGAVWIYSGTVRNCNFTGNKATGDSSCGGAVHIDEEGTVTNCNFTNNTASEFGGAVEFEGIGTVSNCNFTNNTAHDGGAIYLYSGNVTNCNFTNNTAYNGGAVHFYNQGTVINCNFTNNTASEIGGAVYFYYGGIMTDCIFTNNHASYDGGAIKFYNGKGTVTNCNFTNNTADYGGALYFNGNGEVINCNFINNTAKRDGGAVHILHLGTVSNCNFTDNKASRNGGAVYFNNIGNVSNCNFTENTADYYGGAIFSRENNTVTVDTCIFKTSSDTIYPVSLTDLELNINIDNITEGSNATILINTNKTYNGEVTVKIGDKNYTVTLVNGEGSCNITDLKAGNYTATVISKQTDKFQATNKTTNFTVKNKENQTLIDPELNINIDNITEGSNATILINTNKTYNGEVTVKIGDKNYTVTLVNGEGSCNITDLKAGTYTATVILKQTDKFNASSKTINFTVKSKPKSTVIKSSAVTTTYATSKNIIITLTDKQGKVLTGKKVNVVLNGITKMLTTNNKGQVTLATGTTLVPKTYKVSFNFAGDNNYLGSSGSVNLVVKKSTPKLTAKNKKYKAKTKNKKYTITLKNDKKQAIKNVKLTLKVNGKTYTAKTNNKGKATFQIKKLTKKGKYKTTITFKTNQYYNKITTKTTLTIK